MEFWRYSLFLLVAVSFAGCLGTSTETIDSGFTETAVGYAYISSMTEVGETFAYRAREKNGDSYFIVVGGERVGESYDSVGEPVEVGGRLAYQASVGGQEFVVIDGSEGEQYSDVSNLALLLGFNLLSGGLLQ